MSSRDADKRAEMLDSHPEGSQRNWREEGLGASSITVTKDHSGAEAVEQLLEAVVERKNMWLALKQVERNSGAAGVEPDCGAVAKLSPGALAANQKELLAESYQPQPVLKVEIPKPGGKGMRMLGIPTVIDRLLQQALHQVLSPLFEPHFRWDLLGNNSFPQWTIFAILEPATLHVNHGYVKLAP